MSVLWRDTLKLCASSFSLFTYICMCSWSVIQGYICYHRCLFWCSNYPQFDEWEPLQAVFSVLEMILSSLNTCLLSGTVCFKHVKCCLLQSWDWWFLQEALVPFSGEWCLEAKIWTLGFAALKPSQWTNQGVYVCIYSPAFISTGYWF